MITYHDDEGRCIEFDSMLGLLKIERKIHETEDEQYCIFMVGNEIRFGQICFCEIYDITQNKFYKKDKYKYVTVEDLQDAVKQERRKKWIENK